MDVQVLVTIIAVLALINIALIIALFFIAKQNGQNYPKDIKGILGAFAALAVFFSVKSENKLDDMAVNSLMLPIFAGLGIEVPKIELPSPQPTQPAQPPSPDAIAG